MILNWYLDADGSTHRLVLGDEWTGTTLAEGAALPADDVVPLGSTDAGTLRHALDRIASSLTDVATAEEDETPLQLAISAGSQGEEPVLVISGRYGPTAASTALPWTPATAGRTFTAVTDSTLITGIDGASGNCQLSVGADVDWCATLVTAGARGRTRLRLSRDPLEIVPADLMNGTSMAGARIETAPFRRLLDAVPTDEDVTVAMVPERVLVRTASGMIGALPAELAGTPHQATLPASPLRTMLSGLFTEGTHLTVELLGDPATPTLRVRTDSAGTTATVLAPGWRYR